MLFRNKIFYIKDVPNILHEIIIIINESSLEYKERIFMKFFNTLSLGWHNLFTWHISKKNNMVVDITHKATLDE